MDTNEIIKRLKCFGDNLDSGFNREILFDGAAKIQELAAELEKAQETIQTWIVTDKRYEELINLQSENSRLQSEVSRLQRVVGRFTETDNRKTEELISLQSENERLKFLIEKKDRQAYESTLMR